MAPTFCTLLAAQQGPLKWITVYLLSTFKFIGGPLAGISMGLPLYLTVLLTIAGMMTSVVVISYAGKAAQRFYLNRRKKKNKPIFSKQSRRIVRIWQRFGIRGIAFLTPVIFTPIIGTMVALVLGVKRNKILTYMLLSAVVWGIALTLAVYGIRGAVVH